MVKISKWIYGLLFASVLGCSLPQEKKINLDCGVTDHSSLIEENYTPPVEINPNAPPPIRVIKDLAYSNQSPSNKLDLYLPYFKGQKPFPVIIYVHGGGWSGGDKSPCGVYFYSQEGYAVASVNYRLSSEALFPAQIQDIKTAVRWLRANAEKYYLNPNKFGALGESAGGHLVSLLGTSKGIKDFDTPEYPTYSSQVQLVVDEYGPTDPSEIIDQMRKYGPPAVKYMDYLISVTKLLGCDQDLNDCTPHLINSMNPGKYASKDDPPFLITHGDKDITLPWSQSYSLFRDLKDAGVTVEFKTIPNGGHGDKPYVANIGELIPHFLNSHLKIED